MTRTGDVPDEALAAALQSLERLAEVEYGESLKEILAADEPVEGSEYQSTGVRDSHDALWRVGRLVGITVKEPFAAARPRGERDESQTGAMQVWELRTEALRVEHPDWWQYQLITDLLASERGPGLFDWLPPANAPEVDQVGWFLEAAHSERGLFGVLVQSARRYLCGKPELKAVLNSAEASGRASDAAQDEQTPPRERQGLVKAAPAQVVFGGVTSSAAAALVAAVPWLAASMTPLIAGLLLLISAKGLDAFCSRTVPAPATGVVET